MIFNLYLIHNQHKKKKMNTKTKLKQKFILNNGKKVKDYQHNNLTIEVYKYDDTEIEFYEYKGKKYKLAKTKDEATLPKGQSFEEYVEMMDDIAPYGRDPFGTAYLYPEKNKKITEWREDMDYRGDWGPFRKTGIGWKLNPTALIAFALFFPDVILTPIFYLIFTDISTALILEDLKNRLISSGTYTAIGIVLTLIVGYGTVYFDELLKPYGKYHESIELLFINKLEFYKFSRKVTYAVLNYKWFYVGLLGAIIWWIFDPFRALWDYDAYVSTLAAPLPHWTAFKTIFFTLGIAALAFFIFAFLVAIFYGLFSITNLGKDRSKLSISEYEDMIELIKQDVSQAQSEKIKLSDITKEVRISGRTYYEFQRGNRKIGEFLFNIATILITICVVIGVLLWAANQINILPQGWDLAIIAFTTILTIIGILSLGIFLFPQLLVHSYLRNFKYNLIDSFSSLLARLEYIYFESMINPKILQKIDEDWKSRPDLMTDINIIKGKIEDIKKYGTWSYDFPEVIKLILVAASTIIPGLLAITELPLL
jgi:hypothetical protein